MQKPECCCTHGVCVWDRIEVNAGCAWFTMPLIVLLLLLLWLWLQCKHTFNKYITHFVACLLFALFHSLSLSLFPVPTIAYSVLSISFVALSLSLFYCFHCIRVVPKRQIIIFSSVLADLFACCVVCVYFSVWFGFSSECNNMVKSCPTMTHFVRPHHVDLVQNAFNMHFK